MPDYKMLRSYSIYILHQPSKRLQCNTDLKEVIIIGEVLIGYLTPTASGFVIFQMGKVLCQNIRISGPYDAGIKEFYCIWKIFCATLKLFIGRNNDSMIHTLPIWEYLIQSIV